VERQQEQLQVLEFPDFQETLFATVLPELMNNRFSQAACKYSNVSFN
jgi:hypothetical protein